MGSFLSSHDEDGFIYILQNRKGEGDWSYALAKVAATYQATAKGQPVIYYGEEIGLSGANNYPYQDNRYDFDWDAQAQQKEEKRALRIRRGM
jgi:glycosidase